MRLGDFWGVCAVAAWVGLGCRNRGCDEAAPFVRSYAQEKARPRLVRVTVMSRRGVRGTVVVYGSGSGLCFL